MFRNLLYTVLGLGLLATKLLRQEHSHARPPTQQDWHRQEEKHRRHERQYWLASFILTLVIAIGAGASAIYAYKAAMEAHEQAMQAHRQADIAEDALAASTRARLKIESIDATVTRGESFSVSVQGGSTVFIPRSFDVVWFNFEPYYRNYGLAPAQGIDFSPRIFVVGTGSAPDCKERAREWTASEGTSAEVVFPQDDGGKQLVGVSVPLNELKEGAAKVHAIQASDPIYLGVVGCLFYQSSGHAGRTDAYVTALSGDLQRTDNDPDIPENASIYDLITRDDGQPIHLKIKVKILNAWAN
jgi:hypothetical protein